jgi:hypothetical protein
MRHRLLGAAALLAVPVLLAPPPTHGQASQAETLAELIALGSKVGAAETRVRVDALHRVWSIALAAPDAPTRLTALKLLREPIGSSSDHIRMPAIYAAAEIAGSTDDVQVKVEALAALAEPMQAGQVPVRDVAIDAVNQIAGGAADARLAAAAVRALAPAVASGNNGVRIPAINALVRAVRQGGDDRACEAALDALVEPLDSSSLIGGMEIRMMAVAAAEKIGMQASGVGAKAKAMGMLQGYAAKDGWEPEARRRARDAAAAIQRSLK